MPKVIILGSSNAIPTKESENTHMVIVGKDLMLLVDSGTNPILRLEQAGLDLNDLTDIVVTHFHPDHVSGIPLLLCDEVVRLSEWADVLIHEAAGEALGHSSAKQAG